MRNIIKKFTKSIFGGFSLIIVIILFWLSIKIQSNSSYASFAYPAPVIGGTSTMQSPEDICGQWFSYGNDFSADKKANINRQYQACINAMKTNANITPQPMKSIPSPVNGAIFPYPYFTRPAGDGIITESDAAMLPTAFKIYNQWSVQKPVQGAQLNRSKAHSLTGAWRTGKPE